MVREGNVLVGSIEFFNETRNFLLEKGFKLEEEIDCSSEDLGSHFRDLSERMKKLREDGFFSQMVSYCTIEGNGERWHLELFKADK